MRSIKTECIQTVCKDVAVMKSQPKKKTMSLLGASKSVWKVNMPVHTHLPSRLRHKLEDGSNGVTTA